jgi:hypothetical protein
LQYNTKQAEASSVTAAEETLTKANDAKKHLKRKRCNHYMQETHSILFIWNLVVTMKNKHFI